VVSSDIAECDVCGDLGNAENPIFSCSNEVGICTKNRHADCGMQKCGDKYFCTACIRLMERIPMNVLAGAEAAQKCPACDQTCPSLHALDLHMACSKTCTAALAMARIKDMAVERGSYDIELQAATSLLDLVTASIPSLSKSQQVGTCTQRARTCSDKRKCAAQDRANVSWFALPLPLQRAGGTTSVIFTGQQATSFRTEHH
jgi:hypothetical protein